MKKYKTPMVVMLVAILLIVTPLSVTAASISAIDIYCLYNGVKTLAFQAKPLG